MLCTIFESERERLGVVGDCHSLAREGDLADSRPVSSVNSRQFSFVPTVDNIPPERFENAAGSLVGTVVYTG